MTQSSIEILREEDWGLYKSLRLKSLLDSPDSFSATYSHESTYCDEEWRNKLGSSGKAAFVCPLVAFSGISASGLAWGIIHKESDNHANVYQMWVSPEFRGHGIGKALLQRIMLWSREKERSCIHLGATTTNIAAIELYKSVGFRAVGSEVPLREGSAFNVQNMVLDLCA